jgi:hypothetical protein
MVDTDGRLAARRGMPESVAGITDDADVPLEFYRYPADHWVHLGDHPPDRKHLCHNTFKNGSRQRTRITSRWPGHGLQADRSLTNPLASRAHNCPTDSYSNDRPSCTSGSPPRWKCVTRPRLMRMPP